MANYGLFGIQGYPAGGDFTVWSDAAPPPVSTNSAYVAVTPTISAAAYAANNDVGGIIQLANAMRVAGGDGVWATLELFDADNQKAPLNLFLFDSNPALGTYTDKGAFTLGPSVASNDGPKVVAFKQVAATDYVSFAGGGGSVAVALYGIGALGFHVAASGTASLWLAVQTTGTPTYTTTGSLKLRFGFLLK